MRANELLAEQQLDLESRLKYSEAALAQRDNDFAALEEAYRELKKDKE